MLTFPLRGDQAGRPQDAEVMRHGRERYGEALRDLARRPVPLGEQFEDAAPGRIGEGAKQAIVHATYLDSCLNIVKRQSPIDETTVSYNLAVLPMPTPALVRRVFAGLLVANLVVVGAKLAVGVTSGSLAVLGSAVDSSVDALNNVLALIVVRVASREPDEDHPYGHGKFETLSALGIVGFLSISCFELVRGAVNDLTSGTRRVAVSDLQLAVLILTLGVNVLIAWYESRRGAQLGSELLVADAAHTRADVFITAGVVAGVLFARRGMWWIDPALAIIVAVVIVLVAYHIVVRTVPVLVDQRAIPTGHIQETAQAVPGVRGAYSIRSRGPSDLRYAEVTIAVDRHADVESAHAIADAVEERLKRNLRLHEVTVHIEPC